MVGLWLPAAAPGAGPRRPARRGRSSPTGSKTVVSRPGASAALRVGSTCGTSVSLLRLTSRGRHLVESLWLTPPRRRPLDGSFLAYRFGLASSSAPGAWSCLYLSAPTRSRRFLAACVSSACGGSTPLNARSLGVRPFGRVPKIRWPLLRCAPSTPANLSVPINLLCTSDEKDIFFIELEI